MELPPNNIEITDELENRELIKREIKRVSVFGTSKQSEVSSELLIKLGKQISDLGLTAILGGTSGSLKDVAQGVVEKEGKTIIVGSTSGKEAGYVTENIPGHRRAVYYEGKRGAKQKGLFDMSGAYIVLPGKSRGTRAEIEGALDSLTNFDTYVNLPCVPLIFLSDYWKEHVDNYFKETAVDEKFREHIYFISDEAEVEPILLKYAKLKQEHEQKQ